jgi:hypothetical protein
MGAKHIQLQKKRLQDNSLPPSPGHRMPRADGSSILIKAPEPTSSHDSLGLLLLEFALTFHFSVSGFTHNFTWHWEAIRIFLAMIYIDNYRGSRTQIGQKGYRLPPALKEI